MMKRSIFICKKNDVFIEEDNTPRQRRYRGFWKGWWYWKLSTVNLPRLMFIDSECGNIKVVVDVG